MRNSGPELSPTLHGLVPEGAYHLVRDIERGAVDPRTLSRDERFGCAQVMILEGRQNTEIARLLQVHRATVHRTLRRLRDEQANRIGPVDPEKLAAFAVTRAEHLYRKAIEKGNLQLAWQIVSKLPILLLRLGLVGTLEGESRDHRTPTQTGRSASFEERLAEIKERQQRRLEGGDGTEDLKKI